MIAYTPLILTGWLLWLYGWIGAGSRDALALTQGTTFIPYSCHYSILKRLAYNLITSSAWLLNSAQLS